MSDPSRFPQYFGENVPEGFFGPDNPVIEGQRFARYPRGFRYSGPGRNTLFDGAPPLNPMTGKPFEGAILSAPRGTAWTPQGAAGAFPTVVGAIIEVTVGDAGGGEQFRRFLIGPGTPVALRLGDYQSARVLVTNLCAPPSEEMPFPVRIQWVDKLGSAWNTSGRLRSPPINFVAGVNPNLVPDGAIELQVGDVAGAPGNVDITFGEYATLGGVGANRIRLSQVPSLATVRTLGVDFICSADFQGVFFLAGL